MLRKKAKKREGLRNQKGGIEMRTLKRVSILLLLVLFTGTFAFSADLDLSALTSSAAIQQFLEENLPQDSAYLAWKAKYDENKQKFDKSKKTIRIGMITTGAGLLIEIGSAIFLASTVDEYGTVKRSGAAGYVIGALTATVGGGIWIYGALKRHSAKEEMDVLMNEGRINGYIKASINPSIDPVNKRYALTLNLTF